MKYMIQIPSRDRSENMERIFDLLPDAHVFVLESEVETYEPVVPEGQLHGHPEFDCLPEKRNWMLDQFKDKVDCVVQCDDDFEGFWRLIGKKQRLITDSEAIRGLIENQVHVCNDLQLGVFCWSRTRKQLRMSNSTINPFHFTTPMFGIFGLMGKALQQRRFDPTLTGRADLDFTLQTLLIDRVQVCDMRLYAEFGPMRSSSQINADKFAKVQAAIEKRWAKSLKFRVKEDQNQSTQSFVIDVKRKQKI